MEPINPLLAAAGFQPRRAAGPLPMGILLTAAGTPSTLP